MADISPDVVADAIDIQIFQGGEERPLVSAAAPIGPGVRGPGERYMTVEIHKDRPIVVIVMTRLKVLAQLIEVRSDGCHVAAGGINKKMPWMVVDKDREGRVG